MNWIALGIGLLGVGLSYLGGIIFAWNRTPSMLGARTSNASDDSLVIGAEADVVRKASEIIVQWDNRRVAKAFLSVMCPDGHKHHWHALDLTKFECCLCDTIEEPKRGTA